MLWSKTFWIVVELVVLLGVAGGIRAAQGNLEKAKAQADADTARATVDAAKAIVDAAPASVEQAKSPLHTAELNPAYTDIRSPKDGTVISRNVEVGQTVAASLSAPVLFRIAENLRKMQVDTSAAEADIGKLQFGMRAMYAVDTYASQKFRGTVLQVRNPSAALRSHPPAERVGTPAGARGA